MSNKNVFITISLIVLILGGVILGLSLKPKPQPEQPIITPKEVPIITQPEEPRVTPPTEIDISGWKIYHNEEYGFELRYPPDYLIKFLPPDDPEARLEFLIIREIVYEEFKKNKICLPEPIEVPYCRTEMAPSGILFVLSELKKEKTIDEILNEEIERFGDKYKEMIKKVKIGENEWGKTVATEILLGEVYFLVKDKFHYVFYKPFYPKDMLEEELIKGFRPSDLYKVFEQILSTFRFLK